MNKTKDIEETSELFDSVRKLSHAQSKLRGLVVELLDSRQGEIAQEVLDLTTDVRKHLQNNFQKLKKGLDS